ncbi:MAG: NAD(P)/FAD-dependent oxidoreductase [bacterium]|nr:NAD(P)/FAD-dependent oxidoreductase [bacterium]
MRKNAKQVAVIGAGFTGLVAAYRLSQMSYDVTLFEKGKTLGGLASGTKINGCNIERAYHHWFTTDTDILSLVEELRLADILKYRKSSTALCTGGKVYPFTGALDLLRYKPLSFFSRLRAGFVVMYLRFEKNWRPLSKVAALRWMERFSGRQVTEVLWRPLLQAKFHNFYASISMAWLWARIHIRARSRAKGISGEVLVYPKGGFAVVSDALCGKLRENGVKIVTEANIKKIDANFSMPYLVVGDDRQDFDAIIAAIPSPAFNFLTQDSVNISASYRTKLSSVPYLSAVCAIFSSTQDIGEHYWHSVNDTEAPFLVFINHTKLVPKEDYGGVCVYYMAAYVPEAHRLMKLSEEDVWKEWFAYLEKLFPQFDQNNVVEKIFSRFKNAQHIVDTKYEEKILPYETPIPGVYISNFTQIFPEDRGTNYAVREGNVVAKLAAKRLEFSNSLGGFEIKN